ncbi:hypothetical protein DFS33DRAFT_1377404 [Desarmillaria ectypa]|nr:hypothetical protein DFS33DRAFT_1377404 [Desarmillaria ectypa]
MSDSQTDTGFRTRGPSLFGWVAIVWAALKLKEAHEYNKVAGDEEGVAADHLPPYTDGDNEEAVSLLNTEVPATRRMKRKRSKACCMCCGLNCSLFWKAAGIVFAGFGLFYTIKLIKWAVTPAPTGLENMPVYSSSLGCLAAPYIFEGGKTTVRVPVGDRFEHSIDIHGGAVGTILLAEGAADSVDVSYDITVRTDDELLLKQVSLAYPAEDEEVKNSRLLVSTPWPEESNCMRFDIVMYIPPNLKKLHVASHTLTHVQFDPDSQVDLDNVFVTLYATKRNNMIVPHQHFLADALILEVYRGWIVGDAAIVNRTSIVTQRGDGVANIRVHPVPSTQLASFDTVTGAGRTDVSYTEDLSSSHRPIRSDHTSSMNGNLYLTYRDARFSGLVALHSHSYSATGLQSATESPGSGDGKSGKAWTHYVGDQDGGDEILVNSRGWTGLYF